MLRSIAITTLADPAKPPAADDLGGFTRGLYRISTAAKRQEQFGLFGQRLGKRGVIGAENRAPRRHRLIVKRQRAVIILLREKIVAEPEPRGGDVGMACTQRGGTDRQRLGE